MQIDHSLEEFHQVFPHLQLLGSFYDGGWGANVGDKDQHHNPENHMELLVAVLRNKPYYPPFCSTKLKHPS